MQVLKDPLGTKGARLTTYITIPSRYLVMTPYSGGVGVSSRIEDEAERERLRTLVEGIVGSAPDSGGCIVRTAAEGASPEALVADLAFLRKLWQAIAEKAAHTCAGQLVHEDLPLALRVLRDLLSPDVTRVRVDSAATYERIRGVRGALHAELRGAHRALPRRAADLRFVRDRGRNHQGARSQSAAKVGRACRVRSDGGDDDDRREHRRICRSPQPRGDDFPNEPRGGRYDFKAAAAAQPRRHHHHRFHRHDRGGAPPAGASGVHGAARRGSCEDPDHERLAARARGDDSQAQSRELGTRALPGLSKLRAAADS